MDGVDEPNSSSGQSEQARATEELADALRRTISRLLVVRPPVDQLRRATAAANAFADSLDQLPPRPKPWEVSEASIMPGDLVSFSPVSGTGNPIAPPVRMKVVKDDNGRHIEGTVTWGPAYEGPPGHCHGGFTAAMFDELLGWAQIQGGFTGSLTIDYRAPTPLNRELTLRGWVDRIEGRKQFIRGTCHLDGVLLSEAEGLFISLREGVDVWSHLGLN